MRAFLLAAALAPYAWTAGRAIVIAFLVLGLLLGGWLTGQWMTGGLQEETFTSAFFLPGIGTGFVGSYAASTVGLHNLAQVYFAIGVVAWVFMSSVVLNRLFFRPRLAPALLPTVAIEIAPPAVAGNAYFAMHSGPPDAVLFGLAGYTVLMVVAQIPLLPLYRALGFTPGFWSFTFPSAAAGTFALGWLAVESPAGKAVYAWILVATVTGLIGAIAVRTLVALGRRELLPQPSAVPSQAGRTPESISGPRSARDPLRRAG
jgi:tellurite resistance protein